MSISTAVEPQEKTLIGTPMMNPDDEPDCAQAEQQKVRNGASHADAHDHGIMIATRALIAPTPIRTGNRPKR